MIATRKSKVSDDSRVTLDVQISEKLSATQVLPNTRKLKQWVELVAHRERKRVEMTIRFVDAREGRTLNRDFRGKDYATNVLTFVYQSIARKPILGDIVLCTTVVEKEAKASGKPLGDHYTHLVIHGMLHLLGYDHENDDDAQEMEAIETRLLTKLNIADPYLQD